MKLELVPIIQSKPARNAGTEFTANQKLAETASQQKEAKK